MATDVKITIDEMLEAIKHMTMIEVAELVKKMEEEFGVSAAAPVAYAGAMPSEGSGSSAAPEEVVQTEFDVMLVSAGGQKIQVIKEVKTITGLGLKEAKELVEEGTKPIKQKVSREEAEKIKEVLAGVGATVEIK